MCCRNEGLRTPCQDFHHSRQDVVTQCIRHASSLSAEALVSVAVPSDSVVKALQVASSSQLHPKNRFLVSPVFLTRIS